METCKMQRSVLNALYLLALAAGLIANINLTFAQSGACQKDESPTGCLTRQMNFIADRYAALKELEKRLDNLNERVSSNAREITVLRKALDEYALPSSSVSREVGRPVSIVNNTWNDAEVECPINSVVLSGTCDGNPVGIVHPMSQIEERVFRCHFFVNAHDGNTNRRLWATAKCLKVK